MKIRNKHTNQEMWVALKTWEEYLADGRDSQFTIVQMDRLGLLYKFNNGKKELVGKFESTDAKNLIRNSPNHYTFDPDPNLVPVATRLPLVKPIINPNLKHRIINMIKRTVRVILKPINVKENDKMVNKIIVGVAITICSLIIGLIVWKFWGIKL